MIELEQRTGRLAERLPELQAGLRAGVRGLRVKRGLLLHDALRWQLYLVPDALSEEERAAYLRESGLDAAAPLPAQAPRTRQIFRIAPEDAPASEELHHLHDARFSCVACGDSCRTFRLGYLLPADVDRLLAQEWEGSGYDPATFFVDESDQVVDLRQSDKRDLFLRRSEKGCQFLRDDNLCDVQVRFGAAAKPFMCRLFPFLLRQSPSGVQVAVRLGDCLSAPRTSLGTPLGSQHKELRALLAEQDRFDLLPPLLWLGPDRLVEWPEYQALEKELIAAASLSRLLARAEEAASSPPVEAAHPFTYQGLCDLALSMETTGLPLATRALPLDEGARALEATLWRQAIANKDLLQHADVLLGSAQLVVRAAWCRRDAARRASRSGASRVDGLQINRAWREASSTWGLGFAGELGAVVRSLAARALLELD